MKKTVEQINDLKTNKTSGITLIALVVTIVVLLILAGITINMLFSENGIITKAREAATKTKEAEENDIKGMQNMVAQIEELINGGTSDEGASDGGSSGNSEGSGGNGSGGKTPIDKTTSYVGYYADFDPTDDKIDGIIYADLAKGNTGSGTWSTTNTSTYTIPTKTNLKDYYVSQTDYEGAFGTKDVLTPIETTEEKNDRFYVMALENFTTTSYTTFYWYYNAYGNMSDYEDTTKTGFEEGKTNTANMIAKWNLGEAEGGYGAKNDRDMWGVIQEKVSEGWFVPSKDEWSAFAGELGISKTSGDETYFGRFDLSDYYWSSSQDNSGCAWRPDFYNGFMYTNIVNVGTYVRLSASF